MTDENDQPRKETRVTTWTLKSGQQVYEKEQSLKRQEFQQAQEVKRLQFQEEQEQKRLAFEAKMESKKALRDWLMVVITFAAVAAAFWSGYVAYQTRKDTIDASAKATSQQEQLLTAQKQLVQEQRNGVEAQRDLAKTQQKLAESQKASVDVQVHALRTQLAMTEAEERPYVSIAMSSNLYSYRTIPSITLRVFGQTPARHLSVLYHCGPVQSPDVISATIFSLSGREMRSTNVVHELVEPNDPVDELVCGHALLGLTDLPEEFPTQLLQIISGMIIYEDVAANKYGSAFCFQRGLRQHDQVGYVPCDGVDLSQIDALYRYELEENSLNRQVSP